MWQQKLFPCQGLALKCGRMKQPCIGDSACVKCLSCINSKFSLFYRTLNHPNILMLLGVVSDAISMTLL